MADIKSIIAQSIKMRQSPAERLIEAQMGSLTPDAFTNFNAISNKYPGMSKDLVISMVRQGYNVNTPGLDRITTVDGLAALKNDAFRVDKIKKSQEPKRGVLGAIENAFDEVIYDPFKGATRLTFATLRSGYDALTVTGRNITALMRGEEGAGKQTLKDLTGGGLGPLFGESTQLGQVRRAGASLTGGLGGQGEGFFITPESKVGKAQAKSMGQYGLVNGKSYTLGRGIFNGVGMNPNSHAYHIMSGVLDATLNVFSDPSTWFGPGAVGKIITQGKKATGFTEELAQSTKAGQDALKKEALDELEKTGQILVDKQNKKISSQFKRFATKVKQKEQEIVALENGMTKKQIKTVQTLLNSEKKYFALEAADDTVKGALSPKGISEWFINNPKTQTGELSQAVNRLAADMKNTAGFFDGHIILDEVPRYGIVSAGAHGADEYAVTANSAKKLNLLDMSDTFVNAPDNIRVNESTLRGKLADALDKLGKNANEPEFRVYNELSTNLRDEISNLDGFVGSLYGVGDELVAGKSLGQLIGEVAAMNNPVVMSKIADLVQKIWKVDGFTNIRSIYGETGGVVITKGEKIAATRAEIGNAAAEILDPTDLGPNMLKLMSSLTDSKAALAARQQELDDLLNKSLDLEDKENWFNMLRQKANEDPDLLKELIQDPDNAGIKDLLKLELEITENNVFKESIRAQIGITDNFMGDIGRDYSKPLKFILGRQFEPIAELISKETDPVRLKRLFGRKLDDNLVIELTEATNKDEVFKVFLNQFVPGADPLAVKQSLSVGARVATNPVARMVPGVNMNAIKYAENINKAFGRFYIRSTALNLNDLTGLNNGVEDWISSAGLKRILPRGVQEEIIASTQRAIFRAGTNAERAAAVANGLDNIVDEIGKTLKMSEKDILDLKKITKINGGTNADVISNSYSLDNVLGNKGAGLVIAGGKKIELEKGIYEFQLARDVINLPDTRQINAAVVGYKTNLPLYGKAKATKVLLEETGDLWRTAQLVGRASYIFRNIAEMQMRQFFSGHYSLFNNPIGFISMVMADPKGNAFQRKLAERSRYGVNALGDYMKTIDAEVELSASIIARDAITNRGSSTADYGKAGRSLNIFKAYEVVEAGHPEYLKALSYTVNQFSADKFMADVVAVMRKGTPKAQAAYVDNLIATFDEPGNKLREFASAIYDDNAGMREILLKNPGKETGLGVVKDNMNRENIMTWLFDASQPDSLVGQLNLLAGQGAQRSIILDLIQNGETLITNSKGTVVKLKTPYRQKGLTSEQVIAAEQSFTKQIQSLIKPDQMAGARATNVVETTRSVVGVKQGRAFTDWFFDIAARAESKMNFGPEFDASYWDFIAGYADMLSTNELKTLAKNAKKAFAPTAIGGKKIIGRRPGGLRTIEKTLKNRLAKPGYVHQGGASLKTLDSMAAEQASKYVKNLFYDAAKQKQWANAYRLVAPFAQAQYDTIGRWAQLTKSNPVPVYKFGKAFDALTKEGTNVIYDVAGLTYEDNQGFLYRDENSPDLRFKMPIAGSVIGALAGGSIDMKDALQITSPVQSLNLAFGAVSPLTPGLGPAMVVAYNLTGRMGAFGPIDDLVRDIITPFGEPKTLSDIVFPSWLKKTTAAFLGNDATTQRGVKDWASYLASTGKYGDNPLASDATRTQLFNDAEGIAKWVNVASGLFQSISPSTPINEVLVKIKSPDNKLNFMTMTMVYEHWDKLVKKYPGDYGSAVAEFADKFGAANLLIAVSGSTSGVRGSEDAWTFLNNNPDAVDKYARSSGDVIPYFFPGGEYSLKYYNWQKRTGARRVLSTNEIAEEAEGMVYSMLKDQIVEKQIAGRYTDQWYNEQIAVLNKQFGGAKPSGRIVTGVGDEKVATIERALEDGAFAESPVYNQINAFYPKFRQFKDLLNEIKVSNYAELSSKGGVPTLMRNELVALGEQLMTENPEFSVMYYGVFAGILKEND
jgi:hypothetical protein